jgi:hypothetical protein
MNHIILKIENKEGIARQEVEDLFEELKPKKEGTLERTYSKGVLEVRIVPTNPFMIRAILSEDKLFLEEARRLQSLSPLSYLGRITLDADFSPDYYALLKERYRNIEFRCEELLRRNP